MSLKSIAKTLIGPLVSLAHKLFPIQSQFSVRNVPVEPLVDDVILAFASTAAAIQFQALQMRSTAIGLHRTLREAVEQISHGAVENHLPQVQTWMTCLRPIDLADDHALIIPAPGKAATDAECVAEIEHGLNAQHNWLLVAMYEAYEKFFKDLYTVIGFVDPSLWKPKHLAGISPSEMIAYDLNQVSRIVREQFAARDIRELHNAIRHNFPNFAAKELKNSLHADMKLRCAVAGALRHVIVHSGGNVRNEDRLWKNVEQLTGYSLRGTDDATPGRKYELAQFLRSDGNVPQVWTIRWQNLKEPYHGIEDPFMRLFNGLMNHAYLAYRVVAEHFSVTPYWRRVASS